MTLNDLSEFFSSPSLELLFFAAAAPHAGWLMWGCNFNFLARFALIQIAQNRFALIACIPLISFSRSLLNWCHARLAIFYIKARVCLGVWGWCLQKREVCENIDLLLNVFKSRVESWGMALGWKLLKIHEKDLFLLFTSLRGVMVEVVFLENLPYARFEKILLTLIEIFCSNFFFQSFLRLFFRLNCLLKHSKALSTYHKILRTSTSLFFLKTHQIKSIIFIFISKDFPRKF